MKHVHVPRGYWDNYWPRLRQRLAMEASALEERSSPAWRLVPAFAGIAIIVGGAYWLGTKNNPPPQSSDASLQLASNEPRQDAQKVFREMLDLFPNRVSWISFVDGKVDFSISSVPYADGKALVPLLISLRRGNGEFTAQWLVRPGQDAAARVPWSDSATIDLKIHLDAAGKVAQLSCRLSDDKRSASVEGEASPAEGQSVVLGSLRWDGRLTQVQIARLSAKEEQSLKNHESSKKMRL